jgi:hypothetical protein
MGTKVGTIEKIDNKKPSNSLNILGFLYEYWRWAKSAPILSQHLALLTGKCAGYLNKIDALAKQNCRPTPGKTTLLYILGNY